MTQTSVSIDPVGRTQATPTLYNRLVNDVTELYYGWREIPATETWSYISPSSIGISAGGSYPTGTRIRYKQGGSYKYAVVCNAAPGSVSIGLSDSYVLVDSAITDVAISYEANPAGWPGFFMWTTTQVTGFVTPPQSIVQYSIVGNLCSLQAIVDGATSNLNSLIVLSPIYAKVPTSFINFSMFPPGVAQVVDNGVARTLPGLFRPELNGANFITGLEFYRDFNNNYTWTPSGIKAVVASNVTFLLA